MNGRKSIVVILLLSFASFHGGVVVAQAAAQSKDTPKQLEDAYEDIGEGAILAAIKKYLGRDASVWWILARILNSIPGDAKKFEPIQFDPTYADLSMGKLQERLGVYIVARNEVSRMPSSPGQMESLKVLDDEIAKMKAESLKRSGK